MSLETFWFCLIAVLWIGYFVLEGFDFGVGALLPLVGRTEAERRAVLSTIGPVWDGNEVWLLVAGGATFAAFPDWYATLFSGFYLPLLAILLALIVRGISIEYRSKHHSERWLAVCDRAIFVGSVLPAFLWGVAFANIVRGVPIDRSGEFTGTVLDLLNPFALLAGCATLAGFMLHGAIYLTIRTKGELIERAWECARRLSLIAPALLVVVLVWAYVENVSDTGSGIVPGLLPLSAGACALAVPLLVRARHDGTAFIASSLATVLLTANLFTSLFPRVLVSSTDAAFSLTVSSASSTHYTLVVMTVVALALTPLVLLYQGWTYYVFRHRVGALDMAELKRPIDLISSRGGEPRGT